MTVDVEVAGRTRRVSARRDGNGWAVTVDGRQLHVDLAASKGRWSLLVGADAGRGGSPAEAARYRSHEIAIEARGPGAQVIHVDGRPVAVRIADPRALFGRRGHESSSAAGPARVTAPMPGRVVKVLVRPDEAVAAGQPLVVIEAMKMENELRAPRSGTVGDIRVSEGASIEANTVLLVLQ